MEERENIRERLKKHKLSYVWLIGQLALRGIVTDKTEMSSVISGTRNGTKADAIIELAEVENQSEKALNTYYAERNERIGLEDTATSIAALMQQAYSLTESFKEKVKAEYPGVDTLCGYYGSISYKLANMSSQAEIRSCLLKEFEDGRTEIRKGIKARKNEMIKGITDNYRNVIANVSNMKNAKLAMEYLKSLGFDLSDLVKADENPVTTALSVEVDTRFLFIGGKKNEVE